MSLPVTGTCEAWVVMILLLLFITSLEQQPLSFGMLICYRGALDSGSLAWMMQFAWVVFSTIGSTGYWSSVMDDDSANVMFSFCTVNSLCFLPKILLLPAQLSWLPEEAESCSFMRYFATFSGERALVCGLSKKVSSRSNYVDSLFCSVVCFCMSYACIIFVLSSTALIEW